MDETKALVAKLLHVKELKHIHFCHNATHGLNLLIQGLLKEGDHVVTTCMEHNSVLRPLKKLATEKGIQTQIVGLTQEGRLDLEEYKKALQTGPRLVIINHASNVTGVLNPLKEMTALAHEASALVLVDASQTAGLVDINISELGIDFLVATGHKSLRGPSGTGVIVAQRNEPIEPLVVGGTGGNSFSLWHPQNVRDVFEAGTCNSLGIAGLKAALEFSQKSPLNLEEELDLMEYLIRGLKEIKGLKIFGDLPRDEKIPLFSFRIKGFSCSELGEALDKNFGIMVRTGLHCAPFIHKIQGSFPDGTVRVSLGASNNIEEMDRFINSIKTITSKKNEKESDRVTA